jgi:hypothetical protein
MGRCFAARRCHKCETGKLSLLAQPGRKTNFRNAFDLDVPADFEIPTCDRCGCEWFDTATAEAFDATMEPIYRALRKS